MRTACAVVAVAACPVIIACGGGDGPTPAQERYVRQLDVVCRDAVRFQREMERKAEDIGDRAGTVRHFRERNDQGRRFLSRYRAVKAPPQQRDFHGRLVATVESQVKLTERGLRALEANDTRAYERASNELTDVVEERRRLKPGLEFEHCVWRRPARD